MGLPSPTSLQGGSDGAAAPVQSTASLGSSSLDPLLAPFAARLIWWQPVEQAWRHPDRVIAQVLELGTYEEGEQLRRALGDGRLARVLQQAEPGWFSARSWNYWHRRLGLAPSGAVPPPAPPPAGRLSGFVPHLEILPAEQQRLWPSLAGLRQTGFVDRCHSRPSPAVRRR